MGPSEEWVKPQGFLLIKDAAPRWSMLPGGDSDLSPPGGAERRSAVRTTGHSAQR